MSKNIHSYLPLQKFHILPIYGISPELIKESVKDCSRDREKISHCTLLNACSKALGFSGGFAGFQKDYLSNLKPFMEKHRLLYLVDLTKQKYPVNDMCMTRSLALKKQDISERIFFSGKEIPKRIFTGFNFRYDRHLANGFRIGNSLETPYSNIGICEAIDEALKNPSIEINCYDGTIRSIADVVIGRYLDKVLFSYFNLIGDQLVQPRLYKYEIQYYYAQSYQADINNDLALHEKLLDFFVSRIEFLDKGWVDVIPYNDNLVFLKGENGEYDFVYKNQRGELFDHQIYSPFLKRSEIPYFDDEYHFKRWFYFEYKGFSKRISHLAEIDFYKDGGSEHNYPRDLLKEYLTKNREYIPYKIKENKRLDGFNKIKIHETKEIMVSRLITIRDWNCFCEENNEYITYRKNMDDIVSINTDNDNLPVSLTFYDVLKYIDWFNKKYDTNTRLLTYEEYKSISPFKPKERSECNTRDISFFDNEEYIEYPIYYVENDLDKIIASQFSENIKIVERDEFEKIALRFSKNINIIEHKNINFIDSDYFAEWLLEKTCIRSRTLTDFGGNKFMIRPLIPFECSGKFDYTKIGFRLCYDL